MSEDRRSERGKGRIFRPKGKRFLMIAYYGLKKDRSWGEIRESAKTLDETKARKLLDRRLREVANHREGIKSFVGPNAERVTVAELLNSLQLSFEIRQIKSLDRTLQHIKPIREFFGHRRALSVTADTVRRYQAKRREKGRANATINRETELLGGAYRLAIEEGDISFAPKIPSLTENNARQGFFELDELERLLPHLPAPLDEMARFAFRSGWRRGEILSLRWEWVDRRAREVRLPDSKSGKRILPLEGDLWELFERRWRAREYRTAIGAALSPYVFHRAGRALSRNTFTKAWKKARKGAGLPGKLFHDFRRTAARNMVRAGVPESHAMKVTGHKTRSMFERYNISVTDDMREALRRSSAFVGATAERSKITPIR